jgi:dTDP-4-amino-4,6-dideoxygalactose transaminase
MIGSFGLAEIFSFHATKFFNTFEGGAVATNDDELANKIRLMKNFGFSGYDNVIYIGTNGKMSELSAAMGLAGLDALADIIAKNRHNYELYQKEFSIVPEITMVNYPKNEQCNCQYIVIEVDNRISTIERDLIVEILHAENIIARRYFYPGCHQMEPYRTLFPQAHLLLPHTSRLVDSVISFPTGTAVGADEIKIIGEVLRFILTNGKKITRCRKVVH